MGTGQNQSNENDNQNEGFTEEDENFIQDLSPEDLQDEETLEKAKSVVSKTKSAIHQKKKYREEKNSLEEEIEELKSNNNKNMGKNNNQSQQQEGEENNQEHQGETKEGQSQTNNEPQNEGGQEDGGGLDRLDKVEFRQKHNLPEEAEKEVFEIAANQGISPLKAAEQGPVKSFIEEKKQEVSNSQASIGNTGQKPTGDSTQEKDWGQASKEEVEKKRKEIMHNS